ncbi:uncharacterized protein LOC101849484 [Aplysia californica]|uniref:Uncharacterized protein LOC101849484 n=1 Tax=Aplysia californica TaxID=6500 RepID=A0ABM0JZ96_APLCA|nr:uncharacterized protein LOC101849484 [Aplysia californica]XP_005105038.1 uncharacterized protein LOC101849484 [Aplysia californica]XP_012941672.1 uncharacterized protein LOC101849484 [Aplysia californica]XP_012941673.1 uncharacterized protein LOC101849484 [Aplysia californica]XP_012941674.1 uncharacterized protein LOC101849484 [Aplysia californica]
MTSVYLLFTTTMTSYSSTLSLFSSPTTSSSSTSSSLTLSSAMSTTISAVTGRDLEADIRAFWAAFPCPPPWRPQILLEVNATKLEPHVSRTVRAFLAGKCDIAHILSGHAGFDGDFGDSGSSPGFGLGSGFGGSTSGGGEGHDPGGTSLSDPRRSEQPWCDTACRLAVGCAVVFVIMAAVVAVLLCVNRTRRPHKMASTRPSRQQLHLSSSASDAANCTEFSNMEVQGDDDMIYPPFRHRGLPPPPRACHPSCDPTWNCPNCASCHPLMQQQSPSGHYYSSRTYSAVYETIDDPNEDDQQTIEESGEMPRVHHGGPASSLANGGVFRQHPWHNCSTPTQLSPGSVSTVQIRPRVTTREDIKFTPLVAETGFNGDDDTQIAHHRPSALPNYFELEKNCALAKQKEDHNNIMSPKSAFKPVSNSLPSHRTPSGTLSPHNIIIASPGHLDVLPTTAPCCSGEGGTALHSFVMSQAEHNSMPCAGELYRMRHSEDYNQVGTATTSADSSLPKVNNHSTAQSAIPRKFSSNPNTNCCTSVSNCNSSNNHVPVSYSNVDNANSHGANISNPIIHSAEGGPWIPGSYPSVPGTSTFVPSPPGHLYCSQCQLNALATKTGSRLPVQDQTAIRYDPTSGVPLNTDSSLLTPDLLHEASQHGVSNSEHDCNVNNEEIQVSDDEMPLRKPVLALHSQYFAHTSAV